MKVIQAPINPHYSDHSEYGRVVFVAGGISGCPDWQSEFLSKFEKGEDLLFFNPRRNNFNVSDPNEAIAQIQWECRQIDNSDTMIFWFPEETLCPITLFELGKALANDEQDIYIGCHPNYKRRIDVIEQTRHLNNVIKVVDNLDDLAKQLKRGNHGIL